MSKRTVFHPSIAGVTREVEDTKPWTEAGWKSSDPNAKSTTSTTTKAADSK
jgi:hypothetical protein